MEVPVTERTSSAVSLDFKDPIEAELARSASRIEQLLADPAVSANPDIEGSLDDFLGVIYALIRAKKQNFQDRPDRPLTIKAVSQRAARIAAGHVKTDGLWIAGFYFNNALFRTAAVYHRVLKVVAASANRDVPTLQREALARHPGWNSIRLHKVHSQVNELKHEPRGVYARRLVSYADALSAACDLLDLIGAWAAAQRPPAATL